MRNDRIFIEHILISISAIESFIKDVDKNHFLKNRMIQSAIIREIEIIGEAAKNISKETRNKNRHIPWKQITGMRDQLIHHYFGVDLQLVWNTIVKAISPLKKQIENLRKELS
ncbi:MAG: DUF86 domain-containing protein [Phycisphaerae bacterium]|nr:DUF86 domain-containing protein [Phycisphaerae bacterium]